VATMLCEPGVLGVYPTAQVAVPPLPASEQLANGVVTLPSA